MKKLNIKITLFNEAIRERRKELNITQNELAKRVGYRSGDIISKIERGIIEPPYDKVEIFAKALDTVPEKLLSPFGSDEPLVIVANGKTKKAKKSFYQKNVKI